jgi:hypothetical protein
MPAHSTQACRNCAAVGAQQASFFLDLLLLLLLLLLLQGTGSSWRLHLLPRTLLCG